MNEKKLSEALRDMVETWTVQTSDGPRDIAMSSTGSEKLLAAADAAAVLEGQVEHLLRETRKKAPTKKVAKPKKAKKVKRKK